MNQTPPHSQELERSIIASVLMSQRTLPLVQDLLPEHFYNSLYGEIWGQIQKNGGADIAELQAGPLAQRNPDIMLTLSDIIDSATSPRPDRLADKLKSLYIRRESIKAYQSGLQRMYSDHESKPEDITAQVGQDIQSVSVGIRKGCMQPIKDIMPKVFEHIEAYSRKTANGVNTGINVLDKQISFFEPGDYVIIAGRPSMGKSALAAQIAVHEAKKGTGVAFASLETTKTQLALRIICAAADVSMHQLRSGLLPEQNLPKLAKEAGPIAEQPMYIYDEPNITPSQLHNALAKLDPIQKIGLIVVDYMQLMRGGAHKYDSRRLEMEYISQTLKGLAKHYGCPLIAVSQLSRATDSRSDTRPQLSDLRESGAIEQDADVVLFPYRESYYKRDNPELEGKAEIIIGKQRNGPTGIVHVHWDAQCMRFSDNTNTPASAQARDYTEAW